MIELMEADGAKLKHRNAFNVAAMNFTPATLAEEICKHVPGFKIDYEVDLVRQAIADSWPDYMSDAAAREEWGWSHEYDMPKMVADMIENITSKIKSEQGDTD